MLLILGYGNPLRGDDAIGPAVLRELEHSSLAARAQFLQGQQLGPELSEPLAASEAAIFIDAAANGLPGEIRTRELHAIDGTSHGLTHQVCPETLLTLARELYGHAPRAVLVTICGEDFALGAPLSECAQKAIRTCLPLIASLADKLLPAPF